MTFQRIIMLCAGVLLLSRIPFLLCEALYGMGFGTGGWIGRAAHWSLSTSYQTAIMALSVLMLWKIEGSLLLTDRGRRSLLVLLFTPVAVLVVAQGLDALGLLSLSSREMVEHSLFSLSMAMPAALLGLGSFWLSFRILEPAA